MRLEKVTKELFLEILDILDEKLEENRLQLTLNIYGGIVCRQKIFERQTKNVLELCWEGFESRMERIFDIIKAEDFNLHRENFH